MLISLVDLLPDRTSLFFPFFLLLTPGLQYSLCIWTVAFTQFPDTGRLCTVLFLSMDIPTPINHAATFPSPYFPQTVQAEIVWLIII